VDYVQTITVTGDMTVNVLLRPAVRSFPVSVVPNVNGALVFLDGVQVAGSPFPVPQGTHTIQVTAPGYQDFATTINVIGPLTIQARLVAAMIALTIQPNVPNAAIFVDGAQISGTVVNVLPGPHSVRVTAPGFREFNTTVDVAEPMVVQAVLATFGIALTVQPNVDGAIVFVDGAQISGNTVNVRPGRHDIRVAAPGYVDFGTSVNVTAPLVVTARLSAAGITLRVTSNVGGAIVAINNEVKGPVPYSEALPPGSYTVIVSAPGYSDFATTVSLSKPTTINALLQQAVANVSVVIPPGFLDRGNREGAGQLKLFVDGKQLNFRKDTRGFPLTAGRHRIVLTSGALAVELADFDFQAGQSYTLQLYMELQAFTAGN
jgi:hypothetical protein